MVNDESKQVGNFFDSVTSVLVELSHSPYLNLGYWTDRTRSIAMAQKRLVKEFGKFCKLQPTDKLLDVGFGTGAQDILWMKLYRPSLIHGINISPYQVTLASEKIKGTERSKYIVYEVGDACHLPPHLTNFNCITGLECAHLFVDLPSFFSSAYRTLTENGRICLANITYKNKSAFENDILNGIEIELKNYDLEQYRELIKTSPAVEMQRSFLFEDILSIACKNGFKVVDVNDVTKYVERFYPAFKKVFDNFLKKKPSQSEKNILTFFAICFYMRKRQFENGSLGYYLIEFTKA